MSLVINLGHAERCFVVERFRIGPQDQNSVMYLSENVNRDRTITMYGSRTLLDRIVGVDEMRMSLANSQERIDILSHELYTEFVSRPEETNYLFVPPGKKN